MLALLKELILESQESEIEPGIARRFDWTPVSGKATVCIGVRRSGKSTFMSQIMRRLLAEGISRQNILALNFFDDRLHNLRHEGLNPVIEAYYALYPEKKGAEKIYCFFDEIQVIPGWEAFVDRIMRTEKCDVHITGSSAHMLSKEIATQMRGRALAWEMFPFSFREFLDFKGISGEMPLSAKRRLVVQKAFVEYWETGGFPEVAGLASRLRVRVHQEYLNAILFRDLVERHDVSHPRAVSDLASRLVDNVASLYTLNTLTGYLKSLGHKAPKSAVSDYLEWFEDAYFLFTVRLFDASASRANANPKKIYCIDHALAASTGSGILVNAGHLLENLVFTTLRRTTPDIWYYRTRNGKEVDFIIQQTDRSRRLIQACETLVDPQTRKRELSALAEAMDELGLTAGTIVTRDEEDRIDIAQGSIEVVPAWRFLLETGA